MEIKCSQCGAGIKISEESGFISCPYCDSRLYLETDQTVQHFYLKPGLKPEQVAAAISKELSKLELNQPLKLISSELTFLPFWLIQLRERSLFFPAGALEISGLKNFTLPGGALLPYDPELEQGSKVEMPEQSLEDILNQPQFYSHRAEVEKAILIHIPFYRVIYQYLNQSYSGMVDACAGRLYAEQMPVGLTREKDRYFLALFAILSLVFILEAFFIPKFWMMLLAYLLTGITGWYLIQADLKRRGY